MAVSGGPWPCCDGVTSAVVADFDDVEEINADGPARKQRREVAGLAKCSVSVGGGDMRCMKVADL